MPVVEKELQVGKRAVERGGVQLYARVAEQGMGRLCPPDQVREGREERRMGLLDQIIGRYIEPAAAAEEVRSCDAGGAG